MSELNIPLINKVADRIAPLEHGYSTGCFSMKNYAHLCGTPACIAGWTVVIAEGAHSLAELVAIDHGVVTESSAFVDRARKHLGLDFLAACELFAPTDHYVAHYRAAPGIEGYISPRARPPCCGISPRPEGSRGSPPPARA